CTLPDWRSPGWSGARAERSGVAAGGATAPLPRGRGSAP
ncbi:MAG: hypothetical protein AVDCRST_MAG15-3308, partial [uncultured Rubellimicrobium sp.]